MATYRKQKTLGCPAYIYSPTLEPKIKRLKNELTLAESKKTARVVYLYGFNGKENDNEVKGEGNQQDYGMRIYDPRIGKFFSVDPLSPKFPFYTPYQFASNSPISSIDLDGQESVINIRGTSPPEKINAKLQNISSEVLSRAARETQLATNLVNWLVPQLKIPQTWGSSLSTDEKTQVISETVRDFLSFNFTETLSGNVDGSLTRTLSATADLNYKLIFGDKSGEMAEQVKLAFDVLKPAYEKFQDATKLAPQWLSVAIGATDYGMQAADGKYMELTMQAVGQVSSKLVEKGVEEAVQAGLLKTTATVIAPRLLGTFANVLTPLSANAPTTTDAKANMKAIQTKNLTKNTIGALLFYFMNNNQLNLKAQMLQQKPVTDHPEDSRYKRGGGYE